MTKKLWLSAAFLPLVIAPAAIVASCSNDTTTPANQTEAKKEATRLNEVIKSNKLKIKDGTVFDQAKLEELNKTPDKLLTDYLDDKELALDKNKFDYNIDGLKGIDVKPKQDVPAAPAPEAKTMSFRFKVTNKANAGESDFTEVASVAYQYQAPAQPPAQPTPLEKAVKAIEDAYKAKTFKVKVGKETISQDELTALEADPSNFLNDFTQGLPSLEAPLSTKIVKTNFQIIDKPAGSKQQQTIKQINFKVTVFDDQKNEKETEQFTFEYTLQAAPPTQPSPGPGTGGNF